MLNELANTGSGKKRLLAPCASPFRMQSARSTNFVKVGVLRADQRDDDAAVEKAIAQLCRRGHRALVAEQEAANATPRLSEGNQRLLARLEET
jgi:hypothetical protein